MENDLERQLNVMTEGDFSEKSDFIRANLSEKIARVGRTLRFLEDILALYRYMSDPGVHWAKKAVVVGALIYFIVPVDSIPDVAPVVGYLDDLGVVTAAVKFLGSQLKPYYV